MALSNDQATQLRMVNQLITSDPQVAHALVSRWDAMIRREEATGQPAPPKPTRRKRYSIRRQKLGPDASCPSRDRGPGRVEHRPVLCSTDPARRSQLPPLSPKVQAENHAVPSSHNTPMDVTRFPRGTNSPGLHPGAVRAC
jgi:hypothetical protein